MLCGEVWWVEFAPSVGSEICKTRPAIILSNRGESPVRKPLSCLALLVAVMANSESSFFSIAFAADSAPELAANAPQWREQKQDAASFASDWLTYLDNGQYASAVASYTVDGNRAELKKRLQSIRGGIGTLSSRSYVEATVFAAASDDSEHKIRVVFVTKFSGKTVAETVEVLLWHKPPVVLVYTIDENLPQIEQKHQW
ncbi:MAG: type II toxin-antitoxin system PemK/MazF family toxin [Azoarcus sp.]|jgi:hypothetical protein|nr:type II toxin-antitoxin system PemK/MazF family toxin [Azoarcus sp.]